MIPLSELLPGADGVICDIKTHSAEDTVAMRLHDLGFVAGEPVKLVSYGPFGADPVLVQIGFTRFALRRSEAARILIQSEPAHHD